MTETERKFMIVAGESSGDAHGAKLVAVIRELLPDSTFFGAVSHKLREAGVREVVNSDHLSIVGVLEIGRALPTLLSAFRKLKAAALSEKPDAVILVDFPDFNMKLAKSLKKHGLRVIYYISPQLWAWRRYRINTIRKYVDLVISILPFEKDWYAKHGVSHVEYVGSPLAREIHSDTPKAEFCLKHGFDPNNKIVALLPGSRHKEIVRILPAMLASAGLMASDDPSIQFVIALASVRKLVEVDEAITVARRRGVSLPENLHIIHDETFDVLNASDAAAVASGTATLETGIIGTPMAIVYKTSAINYNLLRPLIDVEHFGLINLIAGKRVANELIQDDFTPETLSAELFRLLEPEENAKVREQLREVGDKLGHGGASKRAAEAIVRLLNS
ncbi:MAG: lipid-A-disaccharide synthase [Blastocatellia bacterium]